METDYRDQDACWFHNGIHTYYVSHARTLYLHEGTGTAVSVEQVFSPATDAEATTSPPGIASHLVLERSIDGFSWARVSTFNYAQYKLPPIQFQQTISFSFDGAGAEFRYLRLREPESAAQGLSGFLDHSRLDVNVTNGTSITEPTLSSQTDVQRSCLFDILEDVFVAHPCSFGGVDHWDSPSWFHTYPLESANLERVNGTAAFAYFRPAPPGNNLTEAQTGMGVVWSSVDGNEWTELGTFPYEVAVPTSFSITGLGGAPARFLRVGADRHPDWAQEASWQRPEAFVLFSDLSITGELP